MADQSFDAIAHKFDKNIYGSTKGQLRHELLLHYLRQMMPHDPQRIIDAGGGTGIMSSALAGQGHDLLLNDLSKETLAIARSRINSPKVNYHHGPLQSLPTDWQPDGIVCHAVLEWLSEPLAALDQLIERLPESGWLSLSFFNKDAHRMANLIYGNFEYIDRDMKVKNRVRLNPSNALVPSDVIAHLETLPVRIEFQAGIRCFHDYLHDRSMQQSRYEDVKRMELKYGSQHPYCWLGRYFYVFMTKTA